MVILNFLAALRAARTGRARDLGEQENWGEAFQKTDTYANLALLWQNSDQRSWKIQKEALAFDPILLHFTFDTFQLSLLEEK